jgi:hypothetical protein
MRSLCANLYNAQFYFISGAISSIFREIAAHWQISRFLKTLLLCLQSVNILCRFK